MRKVVCLDEMRPEIPLGWEDREPLRSMSRVMAECWYGQPLARLSALRIKKSLQKLEISLSCNKSALTTEAWLWREDNVDGFLSFTKRCQREYLVTKSHKYQCPPAQLHICSMQRLYNNSNTYLVISASLSNRSQATFLNWMLDNFNETKSEEYT